MPTKAPPATVFHFRKARNNTIFPEKSLLIFWLLSGLRFSSLMSLQNYDIHYDEVNKEIVAVPTLVKCNSSRYDYVTIRCNCCPFYGKEFCLICNDDLVKINFPLDKQMVCSMIDRLDLKLHSLRRTLVITLRLAEHALGLIGKRANSAFFWGPKSPQFTNYSADYKLHQKKPFVPVYGMIHRLHEKQVLEVKANEAVLTTEEQALEQGEDQDILKMLMTDPSLASTSMTKVKFGF